MINMTATSFAGRNSLIFYISNMKVIQGRRPVSSQGQRSSYFKVKVSSRPSVKSSACSRLSQGQGHLKVKRSFQSQRWMSYQRRMSRSFQGQGYLTIEGQGHVKVKRSRSFQGQGCCKAKGQGLSKVKGQGHSKINCQSSLKVKQQGDVKVKGQGQFKV